MLYRKIIWNSQRASTSCRSRIMVVFPQKEKTSKMDYLNIIIIILTGKKPQFILLRIIKVKKCAGIFLIKWEWYQNTNDTTYFKTQEVRVSSKRNDINEPGIYDVIWDSQRTLITLEPQRTSTQLPLTENIEESIIQQLKSILYQAFIKINKWSKTESTNQAFTKKIDYYRIHEENESVCKFHRLLCT